ncbi:TP901 family phage tail tape measure protein [Nicoletella semolina]|uniref:TP901 family phage tail tape measure protein n=1 Tax=Nicoletella semolina TaxID=271160 RepID=A0A4R2N8L9_9PAST|nr:TP901 family phage tail tape measure protein [Nicoletella semolina]
MATELAIAIEVSAVGAFQSLGKSMQGLTSLTNKLEREHVELGSTIQKYMGKSDLIVGDLSRKYDKLGSSIDRLKAKQSSLNQGLARREALKAEREELQGKVLGTAGMVMTAAVPIKLAIDFESAMADVKKVVDFKTPEGFKNLSKDLLELTRTLPLTENELAQIAASGGQLGVKEEELKSFTTTIAKMSTAFDMSASDSGDAMAKLANVYALPMEKISELGDAINELSNSSPVKASDIVNTLGRVGGVAKEFGLTQNATAALSNSFISLGKSPEVAGTAINGMLTKLMTADKGGKAFQAALKEVGISAKQLKANIAKDGQGALTDFLKRLEKLPKENRMGVLVDLFGLEYADDISTLTGNVEALEKSLKTLQETDENGKLKYLGSMEREFAARAATTENNLKLLKNSFRELGVTTGKVLLPAINELTDDARPLIYAVIDFAAANPQLVKGLMAVGTSLVAMRVSSLGVRFAWNGLKSSANELGLVANKLSRMPERHRKGQTMANQTMFKQTPLPFIGQKRMFLNHFQKVLSHIPSDGEGWTIVDIFGGSGLLSHIAKHHKPKDRVIYNDSDGYTERLQHIAEINQ